MATSFIYTLVHINGQAFFMMIFPLHPGRRQSMIFKGDSRAIS